MDKLFDQVWFSENLFNVIFTNKEMDTLMDSVVEPDRFPNIKNGFAYQKNWLNLLQNLKSLMQLLKKENDKKLDVPYIDGIII